jgi:hypothetical protein
MQDEGAVMDFPALQVRDLDGMDRIIPDDLPGGPHVIILAFQQWHQAGVDRWIASVSEIAKRHLGTDVWEIATMSRGYQAFRPAIDGGMRSAVHDADVRRHTLTAYTDLERLAQALEIDSRETVHVFLVGCDGTVGWHGHGEPDSVDLTELESAMRPCR